MLVETTEQALKLDNQKHVVIPPPHSELKHSTVKSWAGELRSALCYISDTECGGLLYPDDLDQKTQTSIGEVLLAKHHPMQDPGPAAMKDYDEVSDFIDLDITSD
jgi:hypothetical protein